MVWLKLITLVTAVVITCADDEFKEAALKGKTCGSLSRNDCLTYHEAQEHCGDVCKACQQQQGDSCSGSSAAPQSSTPATGGTAPPTTAGSGGKPKPAGKKGKGACFHGDDTVITTNGEMKLIDLVGRQDAQVLSRSDDGKLEFSPVYSWLHVDAKKEMQFVMLTTESGRKLSITDSHLIYETDCNGNSKTMFASRVQVGRCLYINDNGEIKETKIVDKHHETKVGIYAPITENGNVVVNGVLASCFTNYEDESFQRIIYSTLHKVGQLAVKVLPSSLIELVYNSPFNSLVHVPEAFTSFIDLNKVFMK